MSSLSGSVIGTAPAALPAIAKGVVEPKTKKAPRDSEALDKSIKTAQEV